MELNKTCLSILELLFENGGVCDAEQITKNFNISHRSTQYQIDKLNNFFHENKIPAIECSNGKFILDIKNKEKIDSLLFSDNIKEYYFLSPEERISLISILIGLKITSCTVDFLCDFLKVSKNTVVSDLSNLRKKLKSLGIRLVSNHKNGYEISGDEFIIRFYLLECLKEFQCNRYTKYFIKLTVYSLLESTPDTKKELIRIHYLVKTTLLNEEINSIYTGESIDDIIIHFYFMYLRKSSCSIPVYIDEINTKPEYKIAQKIFEELNSHNCFTNYSVIDLCFLTAILLSSNQIDNVMSLTLEPDLVDFADTFLSNFEKLTFIHLRNRDELKEKILIHIRPMYYRLKYGISIQNILNTKIKQNYLSYFYLTKKSIDLIQTEFSQQIPDDEIAYLSIYLAGWINQSVMESDQKKAQDTLLIITSGGNSTSSLIQLQLMNLLKPLHFNYKIISSNLFKEELCSQYPLIVTTAPYYGKKENIIPVSFTITASQRNKILQWSNNYSNLNNNSEISQLYDIINMHCTIHDEEILKAKLFNFLNNSNKNVTDHMVSLAEILNNENITLFHDYADIESILCQATEYFYMRDITKSLYAPNILHILSTMGAYGELTSGVLLLHADSVSLCNQLGIQICNLKHHIKLKNNNNLIHTIVLLSTPDTFSHLKVLKDLSTLFRNDQFVMDLQSFSFNKSEELLKTINKILSNYH